MLAQVALTGDQAGSDADASPPVALALMHCL